VAYKSSVNGIMTNITVEEEGEKTLCARGKMNVRVNAPTVRMPALDTLRENAMDLQLKNKVVLITGASRGIGETTAKLFALHGAKVVLNYLNGKEQAQQIVDEINASGSGEAISAQANVADAEQVSSMIRSVIGKFGTVDILVNNAAGNVLEVEFQDLSWDDVQRDVDIIVRGAFNCIQSVLPCMEKAGHGKIINVSTIYTDNPPSRQLKYVVAKSGLVGLTRSLAVELAPKNIQVNMVVPSMVQTDLTAGVNKMIINGMIQNTPMKRLASPVDVARSIIFLASSLNSFTTGQKIMVTGGSGPFL